MIGSKVERAGLCVYNGVVKQTCFILIVCVTSALCWAEGPIRLEDLPDVTVPGTTEKKMSTAKLPAPPETPILPKVEPAPKRTPLEQRLVAARKESRPIPVTTATFSTPKKLIAKTPNDGRKVIDRRGTVAKDTTGRGWVFTFENGPKQVKEIPRRLLPCRLLEKVEEIVAKSPKTRFDISAEITTEKQDAVRQEYILLRRVSVITHRTKAVALPVPVKEATTPGKTPATPASSGDDTDALREKLLSTGPGRALSVATAPETRVEQQQSIAPIAGAAEPTRRSAVVDRTAHIVDDPKRRWAEARFVADNTLREPPMRLLPCILLDRARHLQSKMGQRDRKFRISGEVTHYHGRRYLLLRKVLLERDMGQF